MFDFDWIWYDLLCETAQVAWKLRPESTQVHGFGDRSVDGKIAKHIRIDANVKILHQN